MAADGTAIGQSGVFIRLEGPGLVNGPETVTVGSTALFVATGEMHRMTAIRVQLGKDGISVQKGEEIQIFAEAVEDDLGAYAVGCTLEFFV